VFLHKHCNITKFDTLVNLLSSSQSGENTYSLIDFIEIIINGHFYIQWNSNQCIHIQKKAISIRLKTWLEKEWNKWAFETGFLPENPGPATRSGTPFLPHQLVLRSDLNIPSNPAITTIQHLFYQHLNERNQCMPYQESVLPELISV
jgi:hypothetical protein